MQTPVQMVARAGALWDRTSVVLQNPVASPGDQARAAKAAPEENSAKAGAFGKWEPAPADRQRPMAAGAMVVVVAEEVVEEQPPMELNGQGTPRHLAPEEWVDQAASAAATEEVEVLDVAAQMREEQEGPMAVKPMKALSPTAAWVNLERTTPDNGPAKQSSKEAQAAAVQH